MSPLSCPAGPSRPARWWASTSRSPPPSSARATTPSPRTSSGAPPGDDATPPFIRMAKLGPRSPTAGWPRWSPTARGSGRFRVEAWSDPLATWHHAVEVKVEAGQGAEDLANDLEEGARLLDRVAAEADGEHRGLGQRGRGGAARHVPGAHRPDRAGVRRLAAGLPARAPGPRAGHPLAPLRGLGRPPRGPLRLLVRVLPPLGGPRRRRQGHPRHVRHRPGAAARHRRHGLRRRLPPADPPDRHGQPQGPELAAVPRRQPDRRRARRGRLTVGDRQRRGRARRRPPAAGHDGGLPRLRRPHPRARHGGGAGLRAAGGAGPPVGARSTPSGSPPSPTAPSPTRRTRRRSTRTSTRSTSTTTPRASTPSACG